MALGYDKDLYLLAFDHRSAFAKSLFGITGREPSADEASQISACKRVIFEGLSLAVEEGAPREGAGLVVDEQYGCAGCCWHTPQPCSQTRISDSSRSVSTGFAT